jgi:hypothetical protein
LLVAVVVVSLLEKLFIDKKRKTKTGMQMNLNWGMILDGIYSSY